PVGTGVASDRPVFEWQPLAGASTYVVSTFDEAGTPIAHSEPVSTTRWVATDALVRDRSYVWQVSTKLDGRDVVMPAAPAPPAKFRVIDAATADLLDRIGRRYPGSHLLLGILDARAGLPRTALLELDQVRAPDDHAAEAQRIADALKRS